MRTKPRANAVKALGTYHMLSNISSGVTINWRPSQSIR